MILNKVIHAISLFQDVPQLDGNNVTNGDIAVVENKATREFITSIAKDAHKIGQDNDIYASVMIAGYFRIKFGNSALAQAPNYNLFGMKVVIKVLQLTSIHLKLVVIIIF